MTAWVHGTPVDRLVAVLALEALEATARVAACVGWAVAVLARIGEAVVDLDVAVHARPAAEAQTRVCASGAAEAVAKLAWSHGTLVHLGLAPFRIREKCQSSLKRTINQAFEKFRQECLKTDIYIINLFLYNNNNNYYYYATRLFS